MATRILLRFGSIMLMMLLAFTMPAAQRSLVAEAEVTGAGAEVMAEAAGSTGADSAAAGPTAAALAARWRGGNLAGRSYSGYTAQSFAFSPLRQRPIRDCSRFRRKSRFELLRWRGFNHGNTAFNHGNTAFNHGNVAFNHGNVAFNHGNVAFNHGNVAFNHGNIGNFHGRYGNYYSHGFYGHRGYGYGGYGWAWGGSWPWYGLWDSGWGYPYAYSLYDYYPYSDYTYDYYPYAQSSYDYSYPIAGSDYLSSNVADTAPQTVATVPPDQQQAASEAEQYYSEARDYFLQGDYANALRMGARGDRCAAEREGPRTAVAGPVRIGQVWTRSQRVARRYGDGKDRRVERPLRLL